MRLYDNRVYLRFFDAIRWQIKLNNTLTLVLSLWLSIEILAPYCRVVSHCLALVYVVQQDY